MVNTPKIKEKDKKVKTDTKEMMEAGMHLGHRTSKLHPKMEDFIVGIKNTVHIIDLQKTEKCLQDALNFISELIKSGGTLLIVGTKPPLRNLVQQIAQVCNLPYVVERWLGGTFSNFEVILKRVKYLKELEDKKKKGELDKYTKKEKAMIERELTNLKRKFEGVKDMEKIPEAVFICDIVRDKACLKEARMKGIKVVAIVDTNTDPTLVDYPIPANDDAIPSVKYILEKVATVIKKSKIPSSNDKSNPKSK